MTSIQRKIIRFGRAALAGAAIVCSLPVAAQERPTSADSTGGTLSSHLRTLADNPQNLVALMGAGRAALELGDAQAALTFFGRAEEVAPTDGRIKMWLGSALVQLEQPSTALRFFDEAARLAVPEADLARDRGLAYDMSGDQVRAQRDYKLVLSRGADPEVTRRLALSLAIAGKKEPALALLEEQLGRRDRAAWRTRAFVLALAGDTDGASRAAQAVMPAAQAAALTPFLARLPSLNAADRAMAVHFGRMPGAGRTTVVAALPPTETDPAMTAVTEAGRPDERQQALGPARSQNSPAASSASRTPAEEHSASIVTADHAQPPSTSSITSPSRETRPVEIVQFEPTRTEPVAAQQTPVQIAKAPPPQPIPLPPSQAVPTSDKSGGSSASEPAAPSPAAPASAASVPSSEATASSMAAASSTTPATLADIAAAIADLQDEPQPPRQAARGERREPNPPRARSGSAPQTAKPKANPAPAKAAARHWVQVAGGAVKSALPREYARLKAKAPALLGNRSAWTTPLNATNRLLVGPFDSEAAAQEFVNALAKVDVAAFSWTSPAGQAIERLPAR